LTILKFLTRNIWILAIISLFTDMASEMLYPIMPIYLKTIGFSVFLIGVLEGLAQAVAGLSKGYFGQLSDHSGRRAPFVQLGYTFSAISKPMMAMFFYPLWIFFARTLDRLGKGIRTGARDALLSEEATPTTKGRVFGFHRSMDTFGAVLGPLLALLYLHWYPENYRTLFFLAFIPGLIAVLATLLLKDKKRRPVREKQRITFFSFLKYWKKSPAGYRKLVIGLLAFSLFNSSDFFLLLMAKEAGLGDTQVIGVYIFYNLIYALFAFPAGVMGDNIGLKKTYLIGLLLFAAVYLGMAVSSNLYVFMILFFLYGLYAAATEGISKAWISNVVAAKDTATAIGTYSAFQSLTAIVASSLAGWVWYQYGAMATFLMTGIMTLLVIIYFILKVQRPV